MGWGGFGGFESGFFGAFAHSVHEVPGTPALDGGIPFVGQRVVVGAEVVDEVFCAEEHGCFLLGFDGVAVFLGWFEGFAGILGR